MREEQKKKHFFLFALPNASIFGKARDTKK